MALKGTLKDFSVADIFQLIGQQQKSGSLFIRTEDKEAHIAFDKGQVVMGTFRKSYEDLLLGTMLLRAAAISAEQLAEAIRTQKATRRSLGDILKSMGAISSTVLGEFISLQLKEVLFILFQWKEGLYEFVPGTFQYNKRFLRAQSAEGVLMDGFRMLDEWPKIKETVGDFETVFKPTTKASSVNESFKAESLDDEVDDAFSEFDGDSKPKEKSASSSGLSDEERKVLDLFNGRRSLQEVIYLSRLGTFDTARITVALLDKNYVEATDEFAPTRIDSMGAIHEHHSYAAWLRGNAVFFVVLFSLFFAAPIVAFGTQSHVKAIIERIRANSSLLVADPLDALAATNAMKRLELELELYKLKNGTYPSDLEMLGYENVDKSWRYESEPKRYRLMRIP